MYYLNDVQVTFSKKYDGTMHNIFMNNILYVYFLLKMVLQEGLEGVQLFFQRDNCRLPLSPSLVAKELNIKVSAYHSYSTTVGGVH